MNIFYKFYEGRRQAVFANDQNKHEATVSFGADKKYIAVDDENGDNHYIGWNTKRAIAAVKKILGG